MNPSRIVGRLTIINRQRKVPLKVKQVKHQARLLLTAFELQDWDLAIVCCGDRTIRKLNREHRGVDKATDILSYPTQEHAIPGKKLISEMGDLKDLGEIVLGINHIDQSAKKKGFEFYDYLAIVLTHGICHLLGYEHAKDEDYMRMRRKEREMLKKYKRLRELEPQIR